MLLYGKSIQEHFLLKETYQTDRAEYLEFAQTVQTLLENESNDEK